MSAVSPSSPRPLGGPLIVWEDAFTASEIDRIQAQGDMLAQSRAELVQAHG